MRVALARLSRLGLFSHEFERTVQRLTFESCMLKNIFSPRHDFVSEWVVLGRLPVVAVAASVGVGVAVGVAVAVGDGARGPVVPVVVAANDCGGRAGGGAVVEGGVCGRGRGCLVLHLHVGLLADVAVVRVGHGFQHRDDHGEVGVAGGKVEPDLN